MSFKDKPLKKIVADTRVTIDALHNDIIDSFSSNKKELEDSKKELEASKKQTESTKVSPRDESSQKSPAGAAESKK